MADESTYPATLDGDLRALVPAGTTPTGFSDFLKLLADAVANVQTALGVNPQGTEATVAARGAKRRLLLGPFTMDNVAASLTDSDLTFAGTIRLGAALAVAGSFTSLTVLASANLAAGTLTVQPTANGTIIAGLTAALATGQKFATGSAVPGVVPWNLGQEIGVSVTTNGGYLPTTLEITVMAEVVL